MSIRPEVAGAGRLGHVFENPATKERAVMLSDPAVRADRSLVGHLYVAPGGRVAAAHMHPQSVERFHVIRGRVGFEIGGERRELGPGEDAEVPPGVRHDWWQVGDEPAEVLVDMAPGDRFADMLVTVFGLVRDGLVDRRGMPRLLQLAVTANAYRDAMVFASPPPWVQRALFGVLAPAGRLLGRRPVYERYLTSAEVVVPDAYALTLLDQHGRLRRAPGR
ncbi:cupin domain-containing protein [Actinoplanes sp. URMC 104]|uniref:cupin domain-containing protein n=1 Tax=Actinoplanes sp. URMC 104 TaxID=3423409 RepID=UPI003F1AC868